MTEILKILTFCSAEQKHDLMHTCELAVDLQSWLKSVEQLCSVNVRLQVTYKSTLTHWWRGFLFWSELLTFIGWLTTNTKDTKEGNINRCKNDLLLTFPFPTKSWWNWCIQTQWWKHDAFIVWHSGVKSIWTSFRIIKLLLVLHQ